MHLIACSLKNFKSIAKISLQGLQNVNCFIGPHNSGKTNILDGISAFFDPYQRANLQHRQMASLGSHVSPKQDFDRNILTYLDVGKHTLGTFVFDLDRNLNLLRDQFIRSAFSHNTSLENDPLVKLLEEIENYATLEQVQRLEWQLVMDSEQFTMARQKLFLHLPNGAKIEVHSRNTPDYQQAFGSTFFYRFPDNMNTHVNLLETNLAQLIKNNEYEHMAAVEGFLRDVLGQQFVFEPTDGNRIEVTVEKAFSSPLSRISASTLRLVFLSYVLTNPSKMGHRIILIDNPNLYLHPKGERRLAKRFINLTDKQVLFSTHSARLLVGHAWLVDLKKGFTRVRPIRGEKSMKHVIKLLGIRPSDSFGADVVVFVEGRTDARVYRAFEDIITASLSNPFPRNRVAYIGVGGWTNIRFVLHLELLRSKFVRSRAIAITDGDIRDSETYSKAKRNWSSVFSERTFFSLQENSIESLFLNNPIVFRRKAEKSGTRQNFPDIEELKDLIAKKRDRGRSEKAITKDIIDKYFEKRYTSTVAEQLAKLFKVEEIPEYLARFFRKHVINI